MGQIKHYSQRMYLFCFYGCFILLLLCLFFTYFYISYKENIYMDAKKQSENLCTSVSNSIYTELNNLSTISMNIAYSNRIRSNFRSFSKNYSNGALSTDDFISTRDSILEIYDSITSIIGPFQSASQVNLYTLNGECVGSGYYQQTAQKPLSELTWYEPTKEKNGGKYITMPEHKPSIPARGENQESQMFLSLTRQMNNRADMPDGFIEVIQDCSQFFYLADQLRRSNPNIVIIVYNDRKELIYPYHQEQRVQVNYLNAITNYDVKQLSGQIIEDDGGENLLFTYQIMEDCDFTVIIMNPETAVTASLDQFKYNFWGIALMTIFITMVLCFLISNNLTRPLRTLSEAAGKITIKRLLDETKGELNLPVSSIDEISKLCSSIRDMYDTLRESSKNILLSRQEETRAKLQASQSLINPHFLYNSLTTISIMAEEEMNEEIIFLCHSLCDYYRYISASKEMIVPLSEEIFYTEKYIDCMRLRFGDDFMYTCEIQESVKDILIPKLIIQPIVENAFKYAYQSAPPWILHIRARMHNADWILEIEDNGGQLTNARKDELLQQYRNLNTKEELKSLTIGGMGLKNVYLRMQLLYGERAIFEIDAKEHAKTKFILGGPIIKMMEEYYEHEANL